MHLARMLDYLETDRFLPNVFSLYALFLTYHSGVIVQEWFPIQLSPDLERKNGSLLNARPAFSIHFTYQIYLLFLL